MSALKGCDESKTMFRKDQKQNILFIFVLVKFFQLSKYSNLKENHDKRRRSRPGCNV